MSTSRATLRTGARVLADQDAADFPTDAHYNLWLDDAKKAVWADLVMAGWPAGYTTIQVVTSTGQYGISSPTVFAIRSVCYMQGTTRVRLPRINEGQRSMLLSSVGQGQPSAYEITIDPFLGTVVRTFPAVACTLEVEYIADATAFSSDGDTWYGPARSDKLIMLYAAAEGCRKEGRSADRQRLLEDYRELLEKVTAAASWVDMRNPAMIRDETANSGRDPFDYFAVGPNSL